MKVAIIGSGNIGTDLLAKIERSPLLEPVGMAGIDPSSDGLARAKAVGIATTHRGLQHLLDMVDGVELAFDATSASAHREHAPILTAAGIRSVDLTPAGLGPAIVPSVNLGEHHDAPDVNLISCGAQATVPIVAAVSSVSRVSYAEIVSTISSRSAGPGTRQNIDEFTFATAQALETLGGAQQGKAMALINPNEPPILMRNTIFIRSPDLTIELATQVVTRTVADVAAYVPGYRLTNPPLLQDDILTVLLEVEGAGDYLPRYAGNLDIMTAAAIRVAEVFAKNGSPK